MGIGDVVGVAVKPAVTGTMRARKTKARQDTVTKKQWIAFIGVAVATTIASRLLNDLIERRLGES